MPRGQIDPAAKAQKLYDDAVKGLERAEAAHEKAHNAAVAASENLERAGAWVAYARKNPDLPQTSENGFAAQVSLDLDDDETNAA